MAENIVLTGLMGAGKTTIGKILANIMKYDFLDTDAELEKLEGMSIVEIFEKSGEDYFRKKEQELLKDVLKQNNLIISLGGGALEQFENFDYLKNNALLIYLKATPEELYRRIKIQSDRPLLNNPEPLDTLKKLLIMREPKYLKADIIIDTEKNNSNTVIELIRKAYDERY